MNPVTNLYFGTEERLAVARVTGAEQEAVAAALHNGWGVAAS
jgi:hypothetical protein